MKKLSQILFLLGLSMWAFTSCTNEIEGTTDVLNDSDEITLTVGLPLDDVTRLVHHDTSNQGMPTTWESGDQLIAYNYLGIKSAVFRLTSGIDKSEGTFATNVNLEEGDYTLVYVPKNGIIKNTLLAMIAYYDEIILTQWESGDTEHLKGGEQYQGKFTYTGESNIGSILLEHKLATLSMNLIVPEGASDRFITSVVVWNGMVRHELYVNDILWDDVVRVHMFMHPQEASERKLKFFVKTVSNSVPSSPTYYSQEYTTTKAHLAGKRYSLDLDDLK